jgi:vacuolar protein-sorting-associated protein 4
MFRVHLGDTPHSLAEPDFLTLGAATEQFSGSDVSVVVKDVLMQPIRLLREATHFRAVAGPDGKPSFEPCPPADPAGQEATLAQFAERGMADRVLPPAISMRDFDKVLARARPTVSTSDLEVFVRFTQEFGEDG